MIMHSRRSLLYTHNHRPTSCATSCCLGPTRRPPVSFNLISITDQLIHSISKHTLSQVCSLPIQMLKSQLIHKSLQDRPFWSIEPSDLLKDFLHPVRRKCAKSRYSQINNLFQEMICAEKRIVAEFQQRRRRRRRRHEGKAFGAEQVLLVFQHRSASHSISPTLTDLNVSAEQLALSTMLDSL